ncbi:Uncharacterised protein [Halioglobus japonicus]|nr:Uncharacterised protein [Halioglobus japonicus]
MKRLFARRSAPAIPVPEYDVRGADNELRWVTTLSEAVRETSDPAAEAELIRLRHEVWQIGEYPQPPQPWPETPAAEAGGSGIPTIRPGELNAQVLSDAINRRSCLLVRGLMSKRDADELVAGTDRALEASQRRAAGETGPALDSWFLPFVPEGGKDEYSRARKWTTETGTVYAADSPRNFSRMVDICNSMGILDLLTEYFGVRPVMSVPKAAFKRVPAVDAPVGWHQDIQAYGAKTRALNMWVALSPCGKDARGLSLLPFNPGGQVEDLPPAPPLLSISDETIDRLVAEGTPAVAPVFDKGDVLFFDTLLPHTTQQGDGFSKARYALECWFFAPTTVDEIWLPLQV